MKFITFPTQTNPPTVFLDHISYLQYDGATTLNLYFENSATPLPITVQDSGDADAMINQITVAANTESVGITNITGTTTPASKPLSKTPPIPPVLYPNFGSLLVFFVGTVDAETSYYNVYRSDDAGTTWYKLATLATGLGNPKYIDIVPTGMTYTYSIASVDSKGYEHSKVDIQNGTPCVLSITPGVGQNELTWDLFTYPNGTTLYQLYRWTEGLVPTIIATLPNPSFPPQYPNYTDTDVVAGTQYFYKITSTNDDLNITSQDSNTVDGTPS